MVDWETFPLPFGAKGLSSEAICQFFGSYFDFVDGDWVKDKHPQTFALLIVGSLNFQDPLTSRKSYDHSE